MFAAHHKLDNLVVISDYNKMQIDGTTEEILTLEPLADKWRAFGWEVFEIDGHDWDDIYDTIGKADAVTGKPAMIIAHTIKGKGNRETENLRGLPQRQDSRPGDLRPAHVRPGVQDGPALLNERVQGFRGSRFTARTTAHCQEGTPMANYHDMEMRVVYAQTLNELIERNPNVVCLEADLSKASATIPEVSKKQPAQLHQRRRPRRT